MLNRGVKRLALFSIFLYIFLVGTHYTAADIFAERVVAHNKFSALTLDLTTRTSFNNNPLTSLFHAMGILPSGFDLGAIRVRGEASAAFKYHVQALKTNGDDAFCSRLNLEVQNRSFGKIYSGRLMDFSLNSNIANDNPEDWIFFVSLDDKSQNLRNKICEFNLDMKTYRNDPGEQGGIFAERQVGNVISSGTW